MINYFGRAPKFPSCRILSEVFFLLSNLRQALGESKRKRPRPERSARPSHAQPQSPAEVPVAS